MITSLDSQKGNEGYPIPIGRSVWLADGDQTDKISIIRRNIDKGLPCGSDRFIKRLEKRAGQMLQFRPQGRPKRRRIRHEKGSVSFHPNRCRLGEALE